MVAAAALAASVALAPALARAETMPPPAPVPAPAAEAPAPGGVLDTYSRWMFGFNQTLYGGLESVNAMIWGEAGAASPDPAAGSFRNMVVNLVNEPLTAVTSAVVGEFGNATRSVQRFGINSTVGILGYYDTASQWGYTPRHTDLGLSLCRAGVGEYGYVVLPFVGPRTGRDAVADVALMNLMLWTLAGVAAGTGASFQTIVIAEGIEVVVDIAATRQFDPEARALELTDYETTREAYLAQRRARCAELAG